MGLTRPRSGRVLFKEENIASLPPYTIANRGVRSVPNNRRIFPTLNVKQNLEIARKGDGRGTDGWTLDRIYLVEQNSTLALRVSPRAYILENGHVVYAEVKQRYQGI